MTESKLAGYLNKEKLGGEKPPGQSDLRTALERELDGEDSELAKELQRTRAEEIIARRRITIDRMRGGPGTQEPSGKKSQDLSKEGLTDIIQNLLERGLDADRVGRITDYLLGGSQAALVGFPGAPAPAQGMTFADMIAFYKIVQESNKSDPAVAAILEKMTTRLEAIERGTTLKGEKVDPVVAQTAQITGLTDMIEALIKLGVVQRPSTGVTVEGEPLEVIKAKNLHEERMKELDGEIDYKKKLGETIADIPKRVGAGIASKLQEGEQTSSVSSTMEHMKCTTEACGFDIPYPPEATTVTCPKCGSIYERTKKAGV